MITSPTQVTGRADALRDAFDRSFTEPPSPELAHTEEFLAVLIAGHAYALRVGEIGGLFADKVVAPVPSAVPHLLGVAGLRGTIVPVYDLGALLGYPSRAAARWLVLARSREPVALAFDAFERQLVLSPRDVISGTRERPHVGGAVRTLDGLRPIADLASVLDEINIRVEDTRTTRKEA